MQIELRIIGRLCHFQVAFAAFDAQFGRFDGWSYAERCVIGIFGRSQRVECGIEQRFDIAVGYIELCHVAVVDCLTERQHSQADSVGGFGAFLFVGSQLCTIFVQFGFRFFAIGNHFGRVFDLCGRQLHLMFGHDEQILVVQNVQIVTCHVERHIFFGLVQIFDSGSTAAFTGASAGWRCITVLVVPSSRASSS